MFDRAAQPYIEIYDSITDEYLGRAVFRITRETENVILNYVHNEKHPKRIILQDVYFYPASPDFTAPLPFQKHSYKVFFNVMIRDKYFQLWTPVEIRSRFNIMERTRPAKGQYYFPSVEFSDIDIEGMRVLTENAHNLNK